ncbi:MAG TPA: hypothetical protein PK402_00475 [Tepidisphaeraceae bacterium]|nr:hypothetical protein [Tepidisphaeraceae bacterium]
MIETLETRQLLAAAIDSVASLARESMRPVIEQPLRVASPSPLPGLSNRGPEGTDTFVVDGTPNADNINVVVDGPNIVASVNGITTTAPESLISFIIVNGLGGDDSINIERNTDNAVTVNGGAGLDHVELAATSADLDDIASPVVVNGEADGARLTLWDNGIAFDDTYTITSTAVTRTIFAGVTYAGINELALYCQSGNNTINVESSNARIRIWGGDGTDTCNLTPTSRSLDHLLPMFDSVTFNGGNGVDVMRAFDTNNTFNDHWYVESDEIFRDASGRFVYNDCEQIGIGMGTGNNPVDVNGFNQQRLDIDLWEGDDSITIADLGENSTVSVLGYDGGDRMIVDSSAASSSVTLFGENGDDDFELGAVSADLAKVMGSVIVDGGPDIDSMTLFHGNGELSPATNDFLIKSNEVTSSTDFGTLQYSVCEDLNFFGSQAGEFIDIESTAAGVATSILAFGGTDRIRVGWANGLSTIAGPLNVNGEDGSDRLDVYDDGQNDNANYTFTSSQITGNQMQPINYSGLEESALFADHGVNTIDVINSDVNVHQTVYSNNGDDTINVPSTLRDVSFNSRFGLDTVNINTDGGSPAAALVIGIGNEIRLFVGAGGKLTLDTAITLGVHHQSIQGAVDFRRNSAYLAFEPDNVLTSTEARNFVNAGYAGGAWNGTSAAFSSSFSASTSLADGIGYAKPSELGLTMYGDFNLFPNDMIFRQTLMGDTDLNGTVNFNDLLKVAQSYGVTTGKFWINGDFNYNGGVTFNDLLPLSQNYGQTNVINTSTPARIALDVLGDKRRE